MFLSGLALTDHLEMALDRVLNGRIAPAEKSRSQAIYPAVQV
jgi:hypothetical protein